MFVVNTKVPKRFRRITGSCPLSSGKTAFLTLLSGMLEATECNSFLTSCILGLTRLSNAETAIGFDPESDFLADSKNREVHRTKIVAKGSLVPSTLL